MARRRRRRKKGFARSVVRYVEPKYAAVRERVVTSPTYRRVTSSGTYKKGRASGIQYLLIGLAAAWALDTKTVQGWLGQAAWLIPLALIALGFMARKRGSPYAGALLLLGGLLLYQQYKKSKEKKTDQTKGPIVLVERDGVWVPEETGALPSSSSRYDDDDAASRMAAAVLV